LDDWPDSFNVLPVDDDEAVEARVAEAFAALPGLGADHTVAELRRRVELARRQDWTCTWCGEPLLTADIGAGRTQLDHVIPLIRGGPRAPWNTELLHASCNGSKGGRMTARAWALARLHAVDVVPPDPAGLRNAVEAIAGALRRIPYLLEDYDAAGLEAPSLDELDDLLPGVLVVADAIARARRAGAPSGRSPTDAPASAPG
jgi:hypothetical protein